MPDPISERRVTQLLSASTDPAASLTSILSNATSPGDIVTIMRTVPRGVTNHVHLTVAFSKAGDLMSAAFAPQAHAPYAYRCQLTEVRPCVCMHVHNV